MEKNNSGLGLAVLGGLVLIGIAKGGTNPDPDPDPSTPSLALAIQTLTRFTSLVYNYPHINATLTNNTTKPIVGRSVNLYVRYISPADGLPRLRTGSLGSALMVDGVPQSQAYPSISLNHGESLSVDFIGNPNVAMPRDVDCEVWLEDATTKATSNIMVSPATI